jgi:hypothetical protein
MTTFTERVRTTGRAQAFRAGHWISYLLFVALTGVSLTALYLCGLVALNQIGDLPPPPIVNSLCADEKLAFLREHPPTTPTLLIIGSSVAWRDIDSAQIQARFPGTTPLNAGFCAAQLNQSAFIAHYFVERFPSLNTIVAVVEPHDFRACSKTPAQLFDPNDADDYIFRRRWLYGLYFRYFDALSLQRNVRHLRAVRDGRDLNDPMTFTKFGDGPVTISGDRGLVYGKFEGYDPSCFTDLHRLAESITSSGRRFLLATAPLNPDWVQQFDADGAVHAGFTSGIKNALSGTGAKFWDSGKSFSPQPPMFGDAVHLMWPASKQYTAALTDALAEKALASER